MINRIFGGLVIIGLGLIIWTNYSKAKEAGKNIKIKS